MTILTKNTDKLREEVAAIADTFRALCAELTAWAEKTSAHYFQPPDVLLRARAALADKPAVPEGSEWQPCVKLPITVHVREQRPGEQHVSTREGITPVQSDDLIMLGVDGEEYPIGRELFQRTYRMGSADEPAVPDGREPASVTEQPSDEELALIYHDCCRGCEFMDQGGFENAARAVLARWGFPAPAPPADVSQLSDGYHTFAELYEHRCSLMLALMRALPRICWFSRRHADGELPFGSDDWFIVGAELPGAPITYHLPAALYSLAQKTGALELPAGRPWDGHSAADVVHRLRDWAIEPAPPADGEVAECTAELEEQKPRPDYDRVQKIATEAQIRSAAQYLAKKQHCDGDLIPAIRYAIARWGSPTPQPPADGEVAELVETLKGIAYWRRHGKPGEPAPTSLDIRQADRLDRAAELLERLSPPQPVPVGERPWEREEWCDTDGLCWLGSNALAGCTPTWFYGPPAWAERFPNFYRVLLPAHALPQPEVGS